MPTLKTKTIAAFVAMLGLLFGPLAPLAYASNHASAPYQQGVAGHDSPGRWVDLYAMLKDHAQSEGIHLQNGPPLMPLRALCAQTLPSASVDGTWAHNQCTHSVADAAVAYRAALMAAGHESVAVSLSGDVPCVTSNKRQVESLEAMSWYQGVWNTLTNLLVLLLFMLPVVGVMIAILGASTTPQKYHPPLD